MFDQHFSVALGDPERIVFLLEVASYYKREGREATLTKKTKQLSALQFMPSVVKNL